MFEEIDPLAGERGGSHMRTWLSALDGVEQYECRLCFVGLTDLWPRETVRSGWRAVKDFPAPVGSARPACPGAPRKDTFSAPC